MSLLLARCSGSSVRDGTAKRHELGECERYGESQHGVLRLVRSRDAPLIVAVRVIVVLVGVPAPRVIGRGHVGRALSLNRCRRRIANHGELGPAAGGDGAADLAISRSLRSG